MITDSGPELSPPTLKNGVVRMVREPLPNREVVPGSEALRAEPVPEPVRRDAGNRDSRTTLAFETLDAFLARTAELPDPTWLINDLMPDSGRVFFAAAPSAGKTFLALVVTKYAVAAGRIVYLVLEEGGAKATGNRFRALAFPAGAPVHVLHQRGLNLAEHTHQLANMLHAGVEGPAPVLVLDPFAAVFRGDENDTQQVAAAVAMLNSLMQADPRVLLVVPHHTSKAGELGQVGDPMHAARGSTGLPAWADVQLNLKHVPTAKGAGLVEFDTYVAKNRDGERDYSMRVRIELGSGEVTITNVVDVKREEKASDLRERMIAFVRSSATALTKNKVCAGVKGTKRDILSLIDVLTDEGVFVNDGAGWTMAPDPEFDLTPSDSGRPESKPQPSGVTSSSGAQ